MVSAQLREQRAKTIYNLSILGRSMGRKVKRADLKVGTTWETDWNWRHIYETKGQSTTGLPIDILWEDKFGPGICNHKTMLDWIRKNDAQMKKPQKEASPENPIFKAIAGPSFPGHEDTDK